MKWLKNRWLHYTHRHTYEVVACAEYLHVNKFTGAQERFPAVWLRCVCGHEKAEAIVTSFTLCTRIPIALKKWKKMTVAIQPAESGGRGSPADPCPKPVPVRPSAAAAQPAVVP
jgi:hypothetical protein